MKTAISIPDTVFESAERLADSLGLSRSELYATAVRALIEKHGEAEVTAQLNKIYGPGHGSSLEDDVAHLQARSVQHEKW